MRLFVAIPITEPARSEVAALLGRLRDAGWPVRWVGDEGLHLTLKFFGEVAPERLDVIGEALRFAGQDTLPFPLRLGELGAFPSRHHPRILYLGLDGPRRSSCSRTGWSVAVRRSASLPREGRSAPT
jgi:2'-5' RNA ligase